MSDPQLPRSIVSAQLLARLGVERGMTRELCLKDSGIAAALLDDPKAEIDPGQELQLIRNLVSHLGTDTGLGLDAGSRYHLGIYGVWGFALATSPTPRKLAETAIRYLDLSFAFVRFSLDASEGATWLKLDANAVPADVRQFVLERDFAAMVNAVKEVLPGLQPFQQVGFAFPAPPYAKRFTDIAGVAPRFGQDANRVAMKKGLLDQPLPRGDSLVFRACEDHCRRLVDRLKSRAGLASRVRDILLRSPQCMASIEDVASELHMSDRTLRRKLDAEKTSFRELGDEVRQAVAEELLRTARLKLEEVADRVGYADAVSFFHAFKRWTGQSPSAYRDRHWGRSA